MNEYVLREIFLHIDPEIKRNDCNAKLRNLYARIKMFIFKNRRRLNSANLNMQATSNIVVIARTATM